MGGAISNSGTLIANNCTFENNTSTIEDLFGGGAIFNEGSMNITDSTFKNNYAFNDNNIYGYCFGQFSYNSQISS